MGVDTHMIAGVRACPTFAPDLSSWPIRTTPHYAEALAFGPCCALPHTPIPFRPDMRVSDHGIGKVTFNGAITMRIRPPLPPDRLRSYYEEAARRFGVPWTLLAAINQDGSLSADAERLELADCRPRYRRGHGVALRFEQREGIAGGLRRIGGAAREPQHLR